MRLVSLVFLLGLSGLQAGCIDLPPFSCTSNAQCDREGAQGLCVQPVARCASPSTICPSGYVFQDNAGEYADQCVDTDAGVPTDMSMTDPPDLTMVDLLPPGPPIISSVSPTSGPTSGGLVLTITGENFAPGAKVRVAGAESATVNVSSSTSMTAVLPPSPGGTTGAVTFQIENPDGRSGSTSFTYYLSSFAWTKQPGTLPNVGGRYLVAVADFNNDMNPDVASAVSNSTTTVVGEVVVHLGNGNGTFQTPEKRHTIGAYIYGLVAHEVTQNGNMDLVVSHSTNLASGTKVSILVGAGDGTFSGTSPAEVLGLDSPLVAVGDLNKNTHQDAVAAGIAVVAPTGPTISFLSGNSTGSLSAPSKVNIGAGSAVMGVAVAEISGDSNPDVLATVRGASNRVQILLGNGDGTFKVPQGSVSVGAGPTGLALAELTGDTKLDFVVANETDGTIGLGVGDGSGGFSYRTINGAANTKRFLLADMTGDGLLDIVSTSGSTVTVMKGDGAGMFRVETSISNVDGLGLAVGDINKDNKPDIIVAGTSAVTILLNTST